MAVEVKPMDVKKTQQILKPAGATNAKEEALKAKRWTDFLGDVKSEFKKINWTSSEELRSYTKIVVATTFFFGMGIYLMDLVIQLVLSTLEFMMRWIGG